MTYFSEGDTFPGREDFMYQYEIDGPQNRKRNGQKKKGIPIKGEKNSILLIPKSKLKNWGVIFHLWIVSKIGKGLMKRGLQFAAQQQV